MGGCDEGGNAGPALTLYVFGFAGRSANGDYVLICGMPNSKTFLGGDRAAQVRLALRVALSLVEDVLMSNAEGEAAGSSSLSGAD